MIDSGTEHKITEKSDSKNAFPKSKALQVSALGLLVILIAGLAGLSFWIWQQQLTIQDLLDTQAQLEQTSSSMELRFSNFEQNFENASDRDASAELLLNQQNSRINSLNEELVSLRLNVSAGQNGGVWQLVEAASLLRIAQQYIELHQDMDIALSLYSFAGSLLSQIDDPAIERIRLMLSSDMQILSRQQKVDVEGLYMRLDELAEQLDRVSLRSVSAPSSEFQERNPAIDEQGFLARVGEFLRQYFVVRRLDAPQAMPLSDEQLIFVRQNMQLQLEHAKLALLQGRSEIYQDSISNAIMLVQQNIPDQELMKATLLRDLRELQTTAISQSMPRLSDSVAELDRLISEINSGTGD